MGLSYLFRVSIYFMDGRKAVEIKISENLNTRYFEFVVLEPKKDRNSSLKIIGSQSRHDSP